MRSLKAAVFAALFAGLLSGPVQASDAAGTPAPRTGPAYISVPSLIVNLTSTTQDDHFLKMRIALEVENPSGKDAVQAMMPKVIDGINTYLRDLKPQDLVGAAGVELVRKALQERLSHVLDTTVTNILFAEFLVN